jgi:hypothetical protein
MAPIRLPRELKEHVAKTYAAFAAADPSQARGVVRVSTRLVEGQRSEAVLEGHRIVCDEPVERAGTGQGPSPLQYFLSSLGF